MEIPKINSKTVLYFFIELLVFCALWLLYSGKPIIKNLLYAIILFIGYNLSIFLYNYTKKIIKARKKN